MRNSFINPMLTDLYQLSMLYAQWLAGRENERTSFDMFIRHNPFGGVFTFFAGLEDVLDYLASFQFSDDDINYLRTVMPDCHPEFFVWLRKLDCSELEVSALREGSLAFPRVPFYQVGGPLGLCNFVETAILNQTNFPSLITTLAARTRLAVGFKKSLIEIGLRRAQGADGAMSASKYSYMGGFDATSNVLAGMLYGIPVRGTMAHSFVTSFRGLKDVPNSWLNTGEGVTSNFVNCVLAHREKLGYTGTNESELAAFIQYAIAHPQKFLALVDTYDTLRSGILNYACVALALVEFGYQPLGIRLDSGDLPYLSMRSWELFQTLPGLENSQIVASNDIDEATLNSFKLQKEAIDIFGLGTAQVTCKGQPALGGVYKLTEVGGSYRMKFSNDQAKITIPSAKDAYRLYQGGIPVCDVMTGVGAKSPKVGEKFLCCHPFESTQRIWVVPSQVDKLHDLVWNGGRVNPPVSLEERRQRVMEQLKLLPDDMTRALNPRPYKVSVSRELFDRIQLLRRKEAVIEVLK